MNKLSKIKSVAKRDTPTDRPNPYLKEVKFIGSIPACAKAIDFHGDGGCRIQIDIPENEKPAALTLAAYFLKKQIEVTIKCLGTVK